MLIGYYEVAALSGVGRRGVPTTLDDFHKTAWALYSNNTHVDVSANTLRPFLFSADPVPSRPGIYLFVIRSAQYFPHAERKQLNINMGDAITVSYRLRPVVSETPFCPRKKRRVSKKVTVSDDNVDKKCTVPRLEKAGLQPLSINRLREHSFRHKRLASGHYPPAWFVTAQCKVCDPLLLADKWTSGVGPAKAYGFGMLQHQRSVK